MANYSSWYTRQPMNNAAIGIFDSGLGGLTVAREIAALMPAESLIYVGDQARCPYGPRDSFEVQTFAHQIATFLRQQPVKAIVIACNTATTCALDVAKQQFDVPVIGVINAGARTAVKATQTKILAVIGTQHTIESRAHENAIHAIDDEVIVIGGVTQELTHVVEQGCGKEIANSIQKRGEYYHLIQGYLRPLLEHEPDTLLLGCTHYPVLTETLRAVVGPDIKIVCAAAEVAQELKYELGLRDHLMSGDTIDEQPRHTFYTTSKNVDNFAQKGSRIFGADLNDPEGKCTVNYLSMEELTL